MESIISYIQNNVDESTPIGSALVAASKLESRFTHEDPEELELRRKMEDLRNAEEEDDLLRIPYYSFNSFPPFLQETIRTLSPVFWGGVYIRYSKFIENEQSIMKYMEKDSCIVVYKEDGVYNLSNLIKYGTSWFTNFDRMNINRRVEKRKVLRRYTYPKGGDLVVEDLSSTR